jgi:hypothetical protein
MKEFERRAREGGAKKMKYYALTGWRPPQTRIWPQSFEIKHKSQAKLAESPNFNYFTKAS